MRTRFLKPQLSRLKPQVSSLNLKPMSASHIPCTAHKNGTLTFMARIVGEDADEIVQADLTAIAYTVYLQDRHQSDRRQPVDGHEAVEIEVAEAVFDTLQLDDLWTEDGVGYNFRHTIDISTSPAFTIAGRHFLVEFTFTPVAGQPILAVFRVSVI